MNVAGNLRIPPSGYRRGQSEGKPKVLHNWLVALLVSTVALSTATSTAAERYPTKTVRILLRVPPGGADDMTARLLGTQLTSIFGQQVVIDNRAGAGGLVAFEYMAKVPPDGYTIMLTASGLTSLRALRPSVTIDPWRDFTWISQVSSYMLMFASHPVLPVKDLKGLIALARKHPGEIRYGSSGVGATPHLAMEYFKSVARIDISHVAYRGAGPQFLDLLGGRVELSTATTGPTVPHVKTGRIRALGVTGPKRLPELPEVPTVAESAGLPGFEFTGFYAIIGPANMPKDIVDSIAAAVAKAIAAPGFKERFREALGGFEAVASTPEQILAIAKKDGEKMEKLIRAANIKAE